MTTTTQLLAQWGPHGPGPHAPMGPAGPMGPTGGMGTGTAWTGAGLLPTVGLLLALLAVFALGAYLFVRIGGRTGGTDGRTGSDAALATLRERFARGEIDVEEYDERRDKLAG